MPQSPTSEVRKKLETLRKRFRDKTIREIEELVASILRASQHPDAIEELTAVYQLLHRLAGSAGTLGYTQLGERARKLEIAIKPLADQLAAGADGNRVQRQLKQLLADGYDEDVASLDGLVGAAEPVSTGWHQPKQAEAGNQLVLLIIEPDQELAELISQGLMLYGYRLRSLNNGQQWQSTEDVDLVMVRDTLLQEEGAHWLPRLHTSP